MISTSVDVRKRLGTFSDSPKAQPLCDRRSRCLFVENRGTLEVRCSCRRTCFFCYHDPLAQRRKHVGEPVPFFLFPVVDSEDEARVTDSMICDWSFSHGTATCYTSVAISHCTNLMRRESTTRVVCHFFALTPERESLIRDHRSFFLSENVRRILAFFTALRRPHPW